MTTLRPGEPSSSTLEEGTFPVVRVVDIPGGGPNGELTRAEVHLIRPDGTEQSLPMRLTLFSRLRYGLVMTWPPESVDEIELSAEGLSIRFRDPWAPYERPILPFNEDVPSLWEARYDPRHRQWTLRRIRHLDYERHDSPAR